MPEKFHNKESDALIEELYADLRKAAHRELRRVGSPQTWQTTAMINETWIKLHSHGDWASREHFIRSASTAMRHILIDAARARVAVRRGGGIPNLPLEAADDLVMGDIDDDTLIMLGETLTDLARLDPDLARLVDCRFFAGLTEIETAQVLDISERTVRRRWIQARAWLHREMAQEN